MAPINKRLLIKILLVRRLRRRLVRKQRVTSIRPIFLNRSIQGERILIEELAHNPEYHQKYFRMDKARFDEILELIGPQLEGRRTHSRPIIPLEKLSIALRYLATGASQIDLSFSFRISQPSISKILRQTLSAIDLKLGPVHLAAPNEETWKESATRFRSRWNFPNCCGALDGKHIRIQAPDYSGSTFHNYKGFFSINLMALVGPTLQFTCVSIGSSGSQSDGGVFNRSSIGRAFQRGTMRLPAPTEVKEGIELPHVIVADDAFALKPYVMKPFGGQQLSREQRVYNLRVSRARNVVENAFGILSARWRIFQKPIIGKLELVKLAVHASIVLHNFLMAKKDFSNLSVDSDGGTDGSWRSVVEGDTGLINLPQQGSNNYTRDANAIRYCFMEYFVGEGALDWQWNRICL